MDFSSLTPKELSFSSTIPKGPSRRLFWLMSVVTFMLIWAKILPRNCPARKIKELRGLSLLMHNANCMLKKLMAHWHTFQDRMQALPFTQMLKVHFHSTTMFQNNTFHKLNLHKSLQLKLKLENLMSSLLLHKSFLSKNRLPKHPKDLIQVSNWTHKAKKIDHPH